MHKPITKNLEDAAAKEPSDNFKSTNVKLIANNLSTTTVVNTRKWSNIFSLSPRQHGCSVFDINNQSPTDTSSNKKTKQK